MNVLNIAQRLPRAFPQINIHISLSKWQMHISDNISHLPNDRKIISRYMRSRTVDTPHQKVLCICIEWLWRKPYMFIVKRHLRFIYKSKRNATQPLNIDVMLLFTIDPIESSRNFSKRLFCIYFRTASVNVGWNYLFITKLQRLQPLKFVNG